MIKKHEDFEKSLAAQEEKIKALDEFASKLVEGQHYASEDVSVRRQTLLERRNALLDRSSRRRKTLEDSYRLQQFERDCDETKGWVLEKLKAASDESYLDPTNLQVINWLGVFVSWLILFVNFLIIYLFMDQLIISVNQSIFTDYVI